MCQLENTLQNPYIVNHFQNVGNLVSFVCSAYHQTKQTVARIISDRICVSIMSTYRVKSAIE